MKNANNRKNRRLQILRRQLTAASGPFFKCLIANRGEIAIRVARAAAGLNIQTASIYAKEDALSLHTRQTTESYEVSTTKENASPVDAYLDIEAIITIAKSCGADAIHPGYGFLSENANFVKRCEEENIKFIGPSSATIALFGSKVAARKLAQSCDVPVVPGSKDVFSSGEAVRDFINSSDNPVSYPVMLKASGGGGGRGMRIVDGEKDIISSFDSCMREAMTAFGSGDIFVEQYVKDPRHIEVQVLADASGNTVHLFERDCSVQLRNQKVIEIAPAPNFPQEIRSRMLQDAIKLVKAANYVNAGTVEFLYSPERKEYYFIECNPRIQVEHTVTEQVTGFDLVESQFMIAAGKTLSSLGIEQDHIATRGFALQGRVSFQSAGTITGYREPNGVGVRVDSCGYNGYNPPTQFDPMFAKLVCWSPGNFESAVGRLNRSLHDFHIDGLKTNLNSLMKILKHNQFIDDNGNYGARTSLLLNHPELLNTDDAGEDGKTIQLLQEASGTATTTGTTTAGSNVIIAPKVVVDPPPPGYEYLLSPLNGQVVSFNANVGDIVPIGFDAVILLSMKMENVVKIAVQGRVTEIKAKVNQVVDVGEPLLLIELVDGEVDTGDAVVEDPTRIRPDLENVLYLQSLASDEARAKNDPAFTRRLQRRYDRGYRSARENVNDLVDEGTFVEYGRLRIAGQRKRLPLDVLRKTTPADGIITGIGCINGELFGEGNKELTRCGVLSYDYLVLAGTQGGHGHHKTDRVLELCEQQMLPIVFFCEGGGGRPGDTDPSPAGGAGAGLSVRTFATFGGLSGLIPIVGLTSGYCFAGNAALLGCCDVIIATKGSNIGMGGPAMIEFGGLGVFKPTEIGGLDVQIPNGVVDVLVENETEAVRVAKKYLSYFQGSFLPMSACITSYGNQLLLRGAVPENRLRVYDMANIINLIADTNSVLYLRPNFGIGMYTALTRIAGRPVGILANNPNHLGGAIDADASTKGARFLELCDAYDIPILNLIDCPGFMVGPESEKEACVRRFGRMFVVYSSITVPFFSVIIRKAYGLGAQAMTGGRMMGKEGFCISWPTGEFGGMGLEGAVRLGYPRELAKAKEEGGVEAEQALFDKLVAQSYERGSALNNLLQGDLDDVIDPADTRKWVIMGLQSNPQPQHFKFRRRGKKKRPVVSAW